MVVLSEPTEIEPIFESEFKNWWEQSELILHTERCVKWLNQFSSADRKYARKLVNHLTLVATSTFRQSIQNKLELEFDQKKSIAIYCVRDIKKKENYFPTNYVSTVNSLATGNMHGSEAIVSNLIYKFHNTNKDLILTHPNVKNIEIKNCDKIILVDDLAGSGNRLTKFLNMLEREKLISSWVKCGKIKIKIILYSCTKVAENLIEQHTLQPDLIIDKICPTIQNMHWDPVTKNSVLNVCQTYAKKTNREKMWNGYGNSSALLVFEHSCPNNLPAIFWAEPNSEKSWLPLFPNRSVCAEEMKIFSLQEAIYETRRKNRETERIQFTFNNNSYKRKRTESMVMILLALISKGSRKISLISRVTGLKPIDCEKLIEKCVEWNLITKSRRITKTGLGRLDLERISKKYRTIEIGKGELEYFPQQLRRPMYD